MDKQIIKIALEELEKIRKNYNGLINVILDDWRGYRFVFDSIDVRNCNNDCKNCGLFRAVNNNRVNNFDPGLILASEEDKAIFGPQNYLNCKTIGQYKNCYLNFLLYKAKSKKEIEEELKLVMGLTVIFSDKWDSAKIEKDIKKYIMTNYNALQKFD